MFSYSPELNVKIMGSPPAPLSPASFLLPLGYDELMRDDVPENLLTFDGGDDRQCATSADEAPATPVPQVVRVPRRVRPPWHQLALLDCAVAIANEVLTLLPVTRRCDMAPSYFFCPAYFSSSTVW